jgi:hypothetical protein
LPANPIAEHNACGRIHIYFYGICRVNDGSNPTIHISYKSEEEKTAETIIDMK